MTEYDYWKIFPRMPKKVTVGDITVRDGFQHEEKFVSTAAKIYYLEELIFAGCRNIEVTNLGNPHLMPQFGDAELLLAHLRGDDFKKRCARRGITKVAFEGVPGFEDEADDLKIWRRQKGVIREITIHATCDGHFIDYAGNADVIA